MYEREFDVAEGDARARLDRFLEAHLPGVSRAYIRTAIREGEATLNGERRTAGVRLRAGDRVALCAPEEPATAMRPEAIPVEALFEDDDLIVVAKPAPMLSHPTAGERGGTLANALAHHLNAGREPSAPFVRPGLVHRLDRMTSGLMVVAKRDEARAALSLAFHERRVEKAYLALVCGGPDSDEGLVDAPIGSSDDASPRWGVRESGREARTRWRAVERVGPFALLALEPLTGRTNQLRVHAAHAGWPIAGDAVHGLDAAARFRRRFPGAAEAPRLFLHATRLAFPHPRTGARLQFELALPLDLAGFLDLVRAGS